MNANAPHNAIDNTIDRALSALRDGAPRPGLEGRILSSLEHRAATPQSARFHISTQIALWTAASTALIAIASLAILHHRATPTFLARAPQTTPSRPENAVILSDPERAQRVEGESKNPDAARHATSSEPFSTTSPARIAPTVSSRTQRAARSGKTAVSASTEHDNDDVTATPTEAQLLVDLHAPSHPAPPLPLTPQEKLFLSRLRYGNATELAELDPIVRTTHDDAAAAAFKAFFPDPPPLKQTGDPDDSN